MRPDTLDHELVATAPDLTGCHRSRVASGQTGAATGWHAKDRKRARRDVLLLCGMLSQRRLSPLAGSGVLEQ